VNVLFTCPLFTTKPLYITHISGVNIRTTKWSILFHIDKMLKELLKQNDTKPTTI